MTWRATDGSQTPLYAKIHAEPYLYHRHIQAYERWVPHLPCRTPELLFTDESQLLMVFAELPGLPLEITELPLELELQAYEVAGQVAHAFHGLATILTEVPTNPGAEFVMRMRRSLEVSDGLLDDDTLKWIESVGTDPTAFADERIVPCHRDYSPRNWLVDRNDPLPNWSLIDFERSRHDFTYIDFQRMWPDHWLARPDRRKAFFRGYGRELTQDQEFRLKLIVLRTCVGTISWARDNGDPAFEAWARRTIDQLRREW